MPSLPSSLLWNNALHRHMPGDAVDGYRLDATERTTLSWRSRLLALTILPLPIALVVVMLPLGWNDLIIDVALFQALYTIIGLPLMLCLFDFAMPGMPKLYHGLLVVVGQAAIQGFFCWHTRAYPAAGLSLVRTMGPIFYACLIVALYTVHFVMCGRHVCAAQHKTAASGVVQLARVQLDEPLLLSAAAQTQTPTEGRRQRVTTATYPVLTTTTTTIGFDEGQEPRAVLLWHPAKQVLACTLLLASLFAAYIFCQWFSDEFRKSASTATTAAARARDGIDSYVFFVVVIATMRTCFKWLGRLIDRMKTRGPSLEVGVEIFMSFFYFVFYRALFIEVYEWSEFVQLKAIHILVEVISQPMRMLQIYDTATRWAQNHPAFRNWTITQWLRDDSTRPQFAVRLAVDFMIRRVTAMCSSVAYIVILIFARYGWNRHHYTDFSEDLDADQFRLLLAFIAVGIGADCVVIAVLQWCTERDRELPDVLLPLLLLFESRPDYVYFFAFAGAHILTDVFLSRVDLGW